MRVYKFLERKQTLSSAQKIPRQNYKGFEVLKYNRRGKLVHTYESMHVAQRAEKVGHKLLKSVIENGALLNNHKFKIGAKHINCSPAGIKTGNAKWEGEDGFFNIDGWAKAAF